MRPMNKAHFYLHHLWKSTFSNKPRTALTFLGIFVGVMIFSVGNILIDSYYQNKLWKITNMDSNAVVIQTNQENDRSFQKANKIFIVEEPQPLLSLRIDDTEVMLSAHLHGMTNYNGQYSLSVEDGIYAVNAKIVAGRPIQTSDIIENNPVIVIDEFTESLLFPGQEAVGRYIEVGLGAEGSQIGMEGQGGQSPLKLQVIGVIENHFEARRNISQLKQALYGSSSSVSLMTTVYCPYPIIAQAYSETMHSYCYLFSEPDHDRLTSLTDQLNSLSLNIQRQNGVYCDVVTQQSLTEQLEEELKPLKLMLNLGSAFIIIICGLAIMSIIFFSMKERIMEIGIRKTFGAGKADILFQFSLETLIVSFLASFCAAIVGLLTAYCLQDVIASILLEDFKICFSLRQFSLSICLGSLEGILFGIFPCVYATHITITRALRFE